METDQEALRALMREAIADVLDSRDRIDRETHHDDHDWIRLQREREKKWNDMMEKVRLSVIGAVTVAIIAGFVKFLSIIGALVVAGFTAKHGG